MAISTIGTDALAASAVTTTKLASGVPSRSQLPAGTVLQIVSTTKTDTFSSSSTSWVDVTGLSLSITPTSANSKILIMASVSSGGPTGTVDGGFRFLRNSTAIAVGDAAGSRTQMTFSGFYRETYELGSGSGLYLDSPATTSATTYKIQMKANNNTLYINRTDYDGDAGNSERGVSTITAIEVAA